MVASRRELDGWLLRRAIGAGARHVAERVTAASRPRRRSRAAVSIACDVVVGADGAGSLVSRTFLSPTPPARLAMATGWFAPGDAPMVVRFTPGLAGYLWLFPRPDHVGVGICAPLAAVPTRDLVARLETEVARSFPALTADADAGRYAHTIPSPSADPSSIREIAGERWALVGDAAALADPITGEGIYYALRSAVLLAETLREDGSPRRYPERALADFGADLLKAAALHARFFAPGFARRMIRYAARSRAIRDVVGDLVLGDQGYVGLKRRLARAAPRFALESARALRQWRKWRTPVKTMARPCSSAAATTSSSFTDPPGWMIAVAPARAISSIPSRKGKKASDAATVPCKRQDRLQGREARGVDAAHLARAHADRLHRRSRRRSRWT